MATYIFKAQALTPIHVGCGTEINPTEFFIKGKLINNKPHNELFRFNPNEVLSNLNPEEAERFMQISQRSDLKEIQRFLKSKVEHKNDLDKIDVSSEFAEEFNRKFSNPDNSFRVDMMPRNMHNGQVYIPGSSIKGAIRTAVVNYFTNINEKTRNHVQLAVNEETYLPKKSKILEEKALNHSQSQTEKDVFRLIDIEDATIPQNSTRIDRASNFNPKNPGSEKIQIWLERLKSRADSIKTVPKFDIKLHIDEKAMNHEGVKNTLGRIIDFQTIINSCNKFFWGRFEAEGDKFYGRQTNSKHWQEIRNLFNAGKEIIDPSTPKWCDENQNKFRIILRIGHFSHFECLSVDSLRQTKNPRTHLMIDEGETRTRCIMSNGMQPMPFGWLVMTCQLNT